MSQKRNKIHKPGERLSVYLNKELPDHFFEWIAKQDDVSAFVIYALEQLYNETGNKNVANMLPRRFYFEDTKTSIPDLTFSTSSDIKSENIAITYIEVPKETKPIEQTEAKELSEESPASEVTPRIERDIQQPGTAQDPVVVETINSVVNNEDLKVSGEKPLETSPWANLDKYNPDDF